MYISKTHLSRRMMLRGLGTAVALPLLDCMVPAATALAQTAARPIKRFGVFYVPNGMAMGYWFPKGEGPLQELPPTLRSLEPYKKQVLLMGGLGDQAANLVRGGGDHARSAGTFLTCVPFKFTFAADVYAETTMDQIAAKQFAKETELASLELALDSVAILGSCDGGSSCAYTNTISWSSPTSPLPMENDPRAVFERLFGTTGSTDRAARTARREQDKSILDFVMSEISRLNQRLGPRDRSKFEEYIESVRDIERRIQKAAEQNARELPAVDQPMGIPTDYAEHAKLMMDLLALAYQTDLTRISTFMLAKEVSGRAYPEIGVPDSHHPVSHHQNEPAKLERLHKINEYHMQQFAHLVDKLAQTPEGDGTMLDSSLFLYGTGISDSNTHFHDDLPIALVGGKAAGITGGRYIRFPQGTPLANLHLTLLDKLGISIDKFGDSTGKLNNIFDAGLPNI
jgi:Protein of unknown function (DUF1552)